MATQVQQTQSQRFDGVGLIFKNVGTSIITWQWTRGLLHWIIMSAGTMAECAFLVASLWVSINANVHTFVLLFISEQTTIHITQLATTAYVALPECIVGLAVVTTLSHIRMIGYNHRDYRSWIWSILFLLPTVVFVGLSLFTLGNAVANVTFEMPTNWVVVRALAGYWYAFVSLLYTQVGIPQEKDRLKDKDIALQNVQNELLQRLANLQLEKDVLLANTMQSHDVMLQSIQSKNAAFIDHITREKDERIAALTHSINEITEELRQQKQLLEQSQTAQWELQKSMNTSPENALEAYPVDCKNWLSSGAKTVMVDEIIKFTGHSKRKINHAITSGGLQVSSRNKELVLVSSLIEWLKNNPPKPDVNIPNTETNEPAKTGPDTGELVAMKRAEQKRVTQPLKNRVEQSA